MREILIPNLDLLNGVLLKISGNVCLSWVTATDSPLVKDFNSQSTKSVNFELFGIPKASSNSCPRTPLFFRGFGRESKFVVLILFSVSLRVRVIYFGCCYTYYNPTHSRNGVTMCQFVNWHMGLTLAVGLTYRWNAHVLDCPIGAICTYRQIVSVLEIRLRL